MYIPFFSNLNKSRCGVSVRLSSLLIDFIILLIIFMPINLIISNFYGNSSEIIEVIQKSAGDVGADSAQQLKSLLSSNEVKKILVKNDMISMIALNFALQILIIMVYHVGFWWFKQQTPGDMLFGLKIIDYRNGDKPSFWKIFIRYIGGVICFMTLGILFIILLVSKNHRGFHDYISNTQLIRKEKVKK